MMREVKREPESVGCFEPPNTPKYLFLTSPNTPPGVPDQEGIPETAMGTVGTERAGAEGVLCPF